ncbi:copper resistance protein CopC [Kitasatospora sp. LaBMicrA B282]|uniref:copper resistance CopC/CopD family protein n=1 Tax=Kitasatospora sp. LaBMicrA B282 TaxID=3420949 RepID=UPI003D0AB045
MPLTTRRPRPRRRTLALSLAAALALGLLLAAAGPAAAHAALRSATPANGAVLGSEPRQVQLAFSERVLPDLSAVRVVGPDGRRVDSTAPPSADPAGDTLTVPLRPDPDQGTFVLSWRVTASGDGHTTTGSLTFSVGAPSRTAAQDAGGPDRVTDAVLDLALWLGLAGLALLVGSTAVRLCCLPPTAPPAATDLRGPATLGWTALLLGTLLQLFAYGPDTRGDSLAHLADRSLLAATLPTHQGKLLVARILLLALTASVSGLLARRTATATVLATALALLLALTWSGSSHATDGTLVPLALLATTLHVTAMAVWAGGLATLAVLLTRLPAADLLPVTARFSRLALAAVALLVVTGTYQACRELGSPAALTGTGFGLLLLLKTGLLTLVLAVAATSRSRRSRGYDIAHARRTVLLELGGVTAILIVTVLLLASTPATG